MSTPTLRAAQKLFPSSTARQLAHILGFDGSFLLKEVLERANTFPELIAFVREICRNQCVGFSYAVFHRDELFEADGVGRAIIGDGVTADHGMSKDRRLNVHSMSKSLCAAVMVRALHLNPDVTLSSTIGPFLRPDWGMNPSGETGSITFEQLLTHNSGLDDISGKIVIKESYDGVKEAVQRGIKEPLGQRGYQNCNFSLCRMLLPYVDPDGRSGFSRGDLNERSEDQFNRDTTDFFIDYVHTHFFQPLGLPDEIRPEVNGPPPYVRYYNFKNKSVYPEPTKETQPEFCGASAWFMSAVEFGRLVTGLQFKKSFGRPGEEWSPWPTMSDPRHRVQPNTSKPGSTTYGLGVQEVRFNGIVALGKTGGGGNTYGPTNAWFAFNDLTAVLLINSMGGTVTTHLPSGGKPVALKALVALRDAARDATTR